MTKKESTKELFNFPIFTPETRSKVEGLIEKYKKQLTYVLGGALAILILYMGYKNFVLKPKEKEAEGLIFQAENLFGMDSVKLALNGQGENVMGFLDIIDEYGMTRTGNLAKYYAGLCYYKLGDYEEAIHYLKKYRTKSVLLRPLSYGALGDAYSQIEEYEKAAKYYTKAAKYSKNEFTTPYFYAKAALVYDHLGNYKKVINIYEYLKEEFPKSQEVVNADKYIGRAKAKLASE